MEGGFTFCGCDIAELGLEYAPENENTYVYAPTEAEIHDETFDGHHGGYAYGATKKPKEFILRCFFEEKAIDRGIMTRVYDLFRVGKSGKLVFKRKPWCYYYVTVKSRPKTEFTNYLNGLITITMTAYYPFARGINFGDTEDHAFYNLPSDLYHDDVVLNTGLLNKEGMVPSLSYTNLTSQKSIILFNPGTEPAQVGIAASGDSGSGVTIKNYTTGQECKLVAMSKAVTTDVNKEVFCDGINGKTLLRGAATSEIAFLYHDHGFIELEPAFPILRNVFINYTGNTTIQLINNIKKDVRGEYIFANNKWLKILTQENNSIIVNEPVGISGEERTCICKMNELSIEPDSTMNIDRISFSYKPTFA